LGPLAAAAVRGGVTRLAWAFLALVFAPIVEEFFFRGLLFAGFAHSWGNRVGALIVTVLFIVMHLFETFRYWPATVTVSLLAVGTLAARRFSGSLAPAITFHAGYNLVVVVMAYVTP
jgi:membrane protease YdiL (CAAX protease family)